MHPGYLNTMELTIEQTLQRAVEAHKAGKAEEAEALYLSLKNI